MIKTSLPYKIEEMELIQTNGAVVDMSDLNFISIIAELQKKTSLVFLKNTGFSVTLDFSNCSYEDKAEYLMLYLTEDLSVSNKEFSSTWVKILNSCLGISTDKYSILSDEEIKRFKDENLDFLTEVYQLIISLPLYAMYRFFLNDEVYDMSEFKKADKNPIKCNLYKLIEHDEFLFLYGIPVNIEPLFYTQIFTVENNELFTVIQRLPFMDVLYGLSATSKEEWQSLAQEVESFEHFGQ
ncbi:hypothetical protein [Anaerospora hongkongensis]|uniref:hypothetical protein n=1 Tax=Anaerospora hongkongensis TaxID=244830 RepID=UPI0028972F89|nr:hypothetical protein [Anaerospora hongkongensis]